MTIVSSDKDLAQLVTRRVNMLDVYTGERMGPEEVMIDTDVLRTWHCFVIFMGVGALVGQYDE